MSLYDKASLVLIPSGTKTSKVYSQVPTNGDGDFTFSRSTAATRVNASGNIEKETQNLLLQSNSFDTTWTSNNTTETGGQTGYDGSSDAWLITKLSPSAYAKINQSISSSGLQTASFYAKAGTLTKVGILVNGGDNPYVSYDLSAGTILAQRASLIDSSITDVGGGWYRCTMTYNVTIADVNIYPDWDQTNTGTIYIQDAQLEQGLVARDYIETTTAAVYGGITDNTPRLDYTDSSCPALLLEPLRTNLATLSEHIGGWSNKSNATTTSNYTTSPEGVKNATRVVIASNANGYVYNSNAPAQVIGAKYTLSCYAKRNDSGTQSFGFFKDGSGAVNSAMALTSEWKRFDYTYTASTPSQLGLAGVQGADVSVYGFQVEKDADYPTSYIPTYGSAVTRNADAASKTGVSSLIGQTEGTIFVEFNAQDSTGAGQGIATIYENGSNVINLYKQADNILKCFITTNGTLVANLGSVSISGNVKMAIAYKLNDMAFYINGIQRGLDTSGATPACQNIYIGADNLGAQKMSGKIKQAVLFPTRLSNDELATLTTI